MFDISKLSVDLPHLRAGSTTSYLTALAIMAVATLVRLEVAASLNWLPYLAYFPAVVIITLVCGGVEALLATAASVVLAWILFMPSELTFENIYRSGMFVIGAVSVVFVAGAVRHTSQIIRRLNKMRMTKQEVRDENKETEGSPEAKQHLRQRQREMSRRSVRKAVAIADVILTNPTHFSVALRYDRLKDNAPVVVAKGRGITALAIRDVAGEEKVPILEYPALARAVYYTSREGQEIRDDLYAAVATVLAFVFGLNRRAGAVQPAIEVPATARFDENGVKQ